MISAELLLVAVVALESRDAGMLPLGAPRMQPPPEQCGNKPCSFDVCAGYYCTDEEIIRLNIQKSVGRPVGRRPHCDFYDDGGDLPPFLRRPVNCGD